MSTAITPWTLGGEHDAIPHRVRDPGLEMAADDHDQTPLAPARGAGPLERLRFLRDYATNGYRFNNIVPAGSQPPGHGFFGSFPEAASTSAACPSTFTLCQALATLPSAPTKKVERSMPMYFLPYMDFSTRTP